MKDYSNKISLTKNKRGIYCLDTSMGCGSGMKEPGGCYNDCYAAKSAKQYGYNFSKTVLRHFENRHHEREIVNQISKIKLDFVRMGCSGDPSENWEHAIGILKRITRANKEVIIITRHWTELTEKHLQYLNTVNVCINTSVSALDDEETRKICLEQYRRIKQYCKSVLRIISCDFNLENAIGHRLAKIQAELFNNESTLDNVFRPSKKNKFVTDGIINAKNGVFNGSKTLLSKFNKKTYTGKCSTCIEMCGLNTKNENHSYPNKQPLVIQGVLNL